MNLEEYFETKNSQDFPSEKDYVAIYRTFKQFMNSEIHNEVKAITTRLDNTVYLNDHSANHVKMVMVKVCRRWMKRQRGPAAAVTPSAGWRGETACRIAAPSPQPQRRRRRFPCRTGSLPL